jgi:hypothetical protein
MGPDMAVAMAPKLEDDGFPIDAIHADNDWTTIKKLKMDFKDLKKKDDQNHTTKGITKYLIELSKRWKILNYFKQYWSVSKDNTCTREFGIYLIFFCA